MVTHIVFWNLKEAPEAERAASARKMKELLEWLVGRVPGLLSAGVHQNFTPGGYDLCLVSQLTDRAALEAYQVHPAHLEVKKFVHSVVCQRAAVDYEE